MVEALNGPGPQPLQQPGRFELRVESDGRVAYHDDVTELPTKELRRQLAVLRDALNAPFRPPNQEDLERRLSDLMEQLSIRDDNEPADTPKEV
jgi:hypothetical protein